jgi:YjbE family integral membrane protein
MMGMDSDLAILGMTLEVFFINLLLSGDNAVVIALVCRTLPPRPRRRAMLLGIAAAILLRVYLTAAVAILFEVPCLKLAGAAALAIIGIKLMADGDKKDFGLEGRHAAGRRDSLDLWGAVILILLIDLIMSLDNVVALAAAADGNALGLALGLGLSVPLLIYGSLVVGAVLARYPMLVGAGGALLGWIAGDMAVGDPLIAEWIAAQAPALGLAMPAIGALFVLLEGRIVDQDRKKAPIALKRGDEPNLLMAAGRLISQKLAPQPPAARREPDAALPEAEQGPAAGARVLVADDNPIDQGNTRRILELLGCVVESASDGQQALDRLTQGPYDFLFADCHMPRMDGFELTSRIRQREQATGRHLPILGVVPFVPADTLGQRCLEAGMDDCLHKPVTVTAVRTALVRWLPLGAHQHTSPRSED